jgi:tetraacyldisaccharide 4'-kinase
VIVTRKAAPEERVEEVHRRIAEVAPAIPRVSVYLAPGELVQSGSTVTQPLESIRGSAVRAILSIGDPQAFVRQVKGLGARVNPMVFTDHHAFTAAEVERIAGALGAGEIALSTLKDAVKLAPFWPRLAPPLWYVSQRVIVERGVGGIDRVLDDLVRARPGTS